MRRTTKVALVSLATMTTIAVAGLMYQSLPLARPAARLSSPQSTVYTDKQPSAVTGLVVTPSVIPSQSTVYPRQIPSAVTGCEVANLDSSFGHSTTGTAYATIVGTKSCHQFSGGLVPFRGLVDLYDRDGKSLGIVNLGGAGVGPPPLVYMAD